MVKKLYPTLPDSISPFERPLTLVSVFHIVYFTLNIFRTKCCIVFSFFTFCDFLFFCTLHDKFNNICVACDRHSVC